MKVINITPAVVVQRRKPTVQLTARRVVLCQVRLQVDARQPDTVLGELVAVAVREVRRDRRLFSRHTFACEQSPRHVVTTERLETLAEIVENGLITEQLTTAICSHLLPLLLGSMEKGIEVGGQGVTLRVVEPVTSRWSTELSLLAFQRLCQAYA